MKKTVTFMIITLHAIALCEKAVSQEHLPSGQVKTLLKPDVSTNIKNQKAKRRSQLSKVGIRYSEDRKRGTSEEVVFWAQESAAISNGIYNSVSTLQEWLVEYSGMLVTNQTSFNYQDKWSPDFSSPEKALRSFWHARSKCDVETILHHSDISFKHYWRNAPWLVGTPKMYCSDGATEISILLSGRCVLNGKEYTMLFFRRSSPENPESSLFTLQRQFFVSLYGKYYLTYDPLLSSFADIYKCLGMENMVKGGKYEKYVPKLEKTQVPKSFYLLDNQK